MCLDCGCGKPMDNHGDDRHITMDKLQDAANASGISPLEAADNIRQGVQTSAGLPNAMEGSRAADDLHRQS